MNKVSIIVPIYNVEKYLRRCLDSLINQTYQNIEILCINDGTKDNSQDIIDEYVKRYSNVKAYIKENGGLSDARNYGIKKASGEYLMFVDSDDYLENDAIELLTNKLIEDNADVVMCDMDYVYEDGSIKKEESISFNASNPRNNNDLIFINNSACNKLFSKRLFMNYEFPKGMWYEDLASIPTILASSNIISKVDKVLYHYFQRSGSIVHKSDERIFDIYKAIKKVKNEVLSLNDYKDNEYIKNKFDDLFIIHGANITTLRIVDFDSKKEEFLNKNLENLEIYYKDWYKNHLIKEMGFKKRVFFYLFKNKKFKLLLILLGKKQ